MRNIRILSLDGGGMKGLFSATFMKRFCQDAGIDPTKIWDYFDIIAGTSIGTKSDIYQFVWYPYARC
jgi:uncharacterized protein